MLLVQTFQYLLCVTGVIQNLIIRDLPFDAIRLIYAFELVDIFPPAPILKAHLASMIAHAEHLYRNGDPFVETQVKTKLSADSKMMF